MQKDKNIMAGLVTQMQRDMSNKVRVYFRVGSLVGGQDWRSRDPGFESCWRHFDTELLPHFAVSFGGDTKSRRSFLSGVYATGSGRSHARGKYVT